MLKKTTKTVQIDSADRDIRTYPTNGDCTIYLPRTYENVTSLRLKGAEFNSTFSPANVSGLALWLDASDTSTVVTPVNNNVTTWKDKSGNQRDAQAVGTSVTYESNAIQIGNLSRFGVPSFVLSPTSQITVFALVNQKTNVGAGNVDIIRTSPFQFFTMTLSQATNDYTIFLNSVSAATGYTSTINNPLIYEVVYNSSNVFPYVNGTSTGSFTAAPGTALSTSRSLVLGNTATTNLSYYELLIFNTALSDTQRQQIEGYLAWKWAFLQLNLPPTHPYKSISPNIILSHDYTSGSSLTNDLSISSQLYYILIELEGLNKSDETRVGGDKSAFIDKYFAKIPNIKNSSGIITYSDKNLQENIARYNPPIELLDRLKIKIRTHSQQDGSGFIYFPINYNLTFEVEYLENTMKFEEK